MEILRERGLQPERQYQRERGGEIDLAVLCALGNLGIVVSGPDTQSRAVHDSGNWQIVTIPAASITTETTGVVQAIEEQVKRLGGPLTSG